MQFQGNVVVPRSSRSSKQTVIPVTYDIRKLGNEVRPRMSAPFRERNPVTIGAISIAVLFVLMVAAFKAGDLPLIGGGDTYNASFSEASGIKANDEVRIAGVRVGKVTAVDLKGDNVDVTFKVKTPSKFGTQTGAQIKVKTLLGRHVRLASSRRVPAS